MQQKLTPNQYRKLTGQKVENKMRVVDLNQVQIDWLLAVAYVYMQNSKFEESISLLELVLSNYNRNLDAIRGLGFCYLESGRYEDCIKACNRFLLLSQEIPTDDLTLARVQLILAKAFRKLGRIDEARQAMFNYRAMTDYISE